MRRLVHIFLLFAVTGLPSLPAMAVSDFSLIDHEGRFHQLSRYADHEAVVIYLHSGGCRTSAAELSRLAELQRRHAGDPVAFLILMADSGVSRQAMSDLAERKQLNVPILMDESQLVTQMLDFGRASEVQVIDPKRLESLYHGAFDSEDGKILMATRQAGSRDEPYLASVLSAVLESRPIPESIPAVHGEPVVLDRLEVLATEQISYRDDVVPILRERCVDCHRENGRAPWAMDSHRMVRGWSAMMKETLLTRRMPPGQIDYKDIDRFVDVHHITHDEMATLVQWIDAGARKGGDRDPLLDIEAQSNDWALGEPDLVVEFPPQKIPATGVLDYVFTPVELNLPEDKWVGAYEFNIGNKAALHHVIAYTQDSRQQRQNSSRGGSRTNFGGYAPGREYVVFDEDSGILLQRDMRFMIQFHYTTIGRELVDRTSIGLYFRDAPPERQLIRTAVMNGDFVVPPGVSEHSVQGVANIDRDSYLYSFAPHMHFRGKRVRFVAEYPDGQEKELLSIPNFQHNWQMVYRLREPEFLPAGTRIIADGAFDNSAMNPLNPDPGQEVRWGDQVWDEMFITWMRISEID